VSAEQADGFDLTLNDKRTKEIKMKNISVVLWALIILLIAACGGADPTATPETATEVSATAAPTEVAAETGSMVDQFEHTPDPNLIDKTWQWQRRAQDGNDLFSIMESENYSLTFSEDGSFTAQIDCNRASGRYATHDNGGIFMELGPTTLAACDEGSRSDDMVGIFGGAVQDYRFEEDGSMLVFSWAAGGPVDYYRDAQAGNAQSPPDSSGTGWMVDEYEHTPDPNLINITWYWDSRDPNGNDIPAISVADAQNYTLLFNEDGSFKAKIDCNQASGRYATHDNGSIFMELGPSTLAACGEGSLANEMMGIFGGAVQDYRIEGGGQTLIFNWAAGGPIDTYRNIATVDLPQPAAGVATGTVTAPDGIFLRTGPGSNYPYVGAAPFGDSGELIGVSRDGQWWLADAPNLSVGQVWVAADFVDAQNTDNVPVVAAPSLEPALTGIPWQWVSTTDPAQGTVATSDPGRYLILFNEDGRANIQADCNTVQATYTTDSSNITITPGASTMAACPPDSLESQFLSQLSSSAIYFIEGGNLYLDSPADSGTMRFAPQGAAAPNPDAPAGKADGSTLYLISFGPADAQQPVLAGTQITASFGDQNVSGNAGCNNYSGTLAPVNDYFIVGPIITTRKTCNEPASVMEQEQAYLAALEGTGGYQWEQQLVNGTTLVTSGQIFYTLPDDTAGVMNFVSSP